MKIDNDLVQVNDKVWHDRYGWGVVCSVQTGVCDVKFNGTQTPVTFTDGGRMNGIKVLWWQPPMLFTPRKNIDYTGLKEVIAEIIKFKYEV